MLNFYHHEQKKVFSENTFNHQMSENKREEQKMKMIFQISSNNTSSWLKFR